jgi:plastocyanin
MGEFYYRPTPVTVRVGEPVTFVNEGAIEHTVADTTPAGEIRSRLIKPRPLKTGERQRVTFRRPGTVDYICTFHPTEMRGSVTVTP